MKTEQFYFDYKCLAEQNAVQSIPYIVNTAGHPTTKCYLANRYIAIKQTCRLFLISNFRRVLNIVCILLVHFTLYIQPLKMELIEGSETSANNNRTPGKYPKEYIKDL